MSPNCDYILSGGLIDGAVWGDSFLSLATHFSVRYPLSRMHVSSVP